MAVFFKNKRIAALIRTGLTMDVDESTQYWIGRGENDSCYACAIGMAMIGKMVVFRAMRLSSKNSVITTETN